MQKEIFRIIDANLNRLREGLRVVEDILRFYYQDKNLFRNIKRLRHKVRFLASNIWDLKGLVFYRDVREDIGKTKDFLEMRRRDLLDILNASLQRAKESLRVLEELAKIKNFKNSSELKKLRFKLYSLEKSIFKKILR